MEPQLVRRIAAEVASNLKLEVSVLPTIERYVRRAINRILVFCGRSDFPQPLEDIAAQITEDMLRADEVVSPGSQVASVTRGDTSISYRDKTSALQGTVDFIKDYEAQLVPFKKMRLPKDVPT